MNFESVENNGMHDLQQIQNSKFFIQN